MIPRSHFTLALLLAVATGFSGCASEQDFDLAIVGATGIDGTGASTATWRVPAVEFDPNW